MTMTQHNLLSLVGRALIALLFVPAGVMKLMGFAGVVGYIASKGIPMPEVCAAIAIAAELGLGLLVLVGWNARWAALALALFTAIITPMFHDFWNMTGQQAMQNQQAFFKNLAVVGGLLLIGCFGAGGWSLDAKQHRNSP